MSGPPRPVRLGLIGAGRWGRSLIRTVTAIPGAVLARVASRNPETAALALGCTVTPDWRGLAEDGGLDGVIVASPPGLHSEMALACIAAGLPVLVEKPLTMDLAEAQGLLASAVRARAIVSVDHTHLFHPAYEALKDRAKTLGPALALESAGGNWGPFRPDAAPLWDYGPHDAAFCLDLLGGKPASVEAELTESRRLPEGLGELVRVTLAFPGGVAAVFFVGNIMAQKTRRLEVRLEGGTLVLDDLAPDKLTLRRGGRTEVLPHSGEPPLTCAVKAFVQAIRDGDRSPESLRLAVGVVEVLSLAERLASRS